MTQARIINAIVWIAIAIAVLVMVITQPWSARSIIVAVAYYLGAFTALWGVIDQTIKEREQ